MLILKKEQGKEKSKQKRIYALTAIGALALLVVVMATRSGSEEDSKNPIDLNETQLQSNLDDFMDDQLSDNSIGSNKTDNQSKEQNFASNDEKESSKVENNTKDKVESKNDIDKNLADNKAAVTPVPKESIVNKPDIQGNKVAEDGKTPETVATGSNQVVAKTSDDGNKVTEKPKKDQSDLSEGVAGEEYDETVNLAVQNLNFDAAAGISWPLQGDIIMNYSIDHAVYHATLAQFRTNPAILIGCEAGAEVHSAVKCVVTKVENDAKTGVTVTTAIGGDYELKYGQLTESSLKVGDVLEEGDLIGNVAEVSRFYRLEGNNLYFQAMQGDKSINPMLLLRAVE